MNYVSSHRGCEFCHRATAISLREDLSPEEKNVALDALFDLAARAATARRAYVRHRRRRFT